VMVNVTATFPQTFHSSSNERLNRRREHWVRTMGSFEDLVEQYLQHDQHTVCTCCTQRYCVI
jgi:hypothetical protein